MFDDYAHVYVAIKFVIVRWAKCSEAFKRIITGEATDGATISMGPFRFMLHLCAYMEPTEPEMDLLVMVQW